MRVLIVLALISVISACASPPCRGRMSSVNAPASAPIVSAPQGAP
jgi:hypothetical protein